MFIFKDNLAGALIVAIKDQEKFERESLHYTIDSAKLAGWKEILDFLENKLSSSFVRIIPS